MPRPTNKKVLLQESHIRFQELLDFLDQLKPEVVHKEFPSDTLNRNIRDVLAHLHQWHNMFLQWYTIGMKGKKPPMPATGYTWKTVPELNRNIQKMYSETPLQEIRISLKDSHHQIQNIIKKHSNKELFTKKRYGWTGSTSLGAYLISASCSHYVWAFKLIKKGLAAAPQQK